MTRLVAVALWLVLAPSVGLWLVLAPSVALACPGCVASPYGDRTFGWAYLILYAAPFFVASAIAGVLAYALRSRRAATAGAWRSLWPFGCRLQRTPDASGRGTLALRHPHGPDKETT